MSQPAGGCSLALLRYQVNTYTLTALDNPASPRAASTSETMRASEHARLTAMSCNASQNSASSDIDVRWPETLKDRLIGRMSLSSRDWRAPSHCQGEACWTVRPGRSFMMHRDRSFLSDRRCGQTPQPGHSPAAMPLRAASYRSCARSWQSRLPCHSR